MGGDRERKSAERGRDRQPCKTGGDGEKGKERKGRSKEGEKLMMGGEEEEEWFIHRAPSRGG